MIEYNVKLERWRDTETKEIVSVRVFKSLFHAAASISRAAKQSIKTGGTASPGSPPRTKRGLLRRAIRFEVNRVEKSAVIGPIATAIEGAAAPHEFGGQYKKQEYPARPFMRPALERNLHRFAGAFSGSIGG